jgi:hypothetical protein
VRISRHFSAVAVWRWLAVACTGAAVVAVVSGMHRPESGITVLAARTNLPAGMVVSTADVTQIRVTLPNAVAARLIRSLPSGVRLTTSRPKGMLLSAADFTATDSAQLRVVSLSVEDGHVPAALTRGDVVDVWVSPTSAWVSSGVTPGRRVATSVVVDSVGQRAATGSTPVELQVGLGAVPAVVSASHIGSIDLVLVPNATHMVVAQ